MKIKEAQVNQSLIRQIKEVNPLVGAQLARNIQKYIDKARCVQSLCKEVAYYSSKMSDTLDGGYLAMTYNCFADLAKQNDELKMVGEALADSFQMAQAVSTDIHFGWTDLFISLAEAMEA